MTIPDLKRVELVFDVASGHPSGTLAVPPTRAVPFESWAELFSLLDAALELLRAEAPTTGGAP